MLNSRLIASLQAVAQTYAVVGLPIAAHLLHGHEGGQCLLEGGLGRLAEEGSGRLALHPGQTGHLQAPAAVDVVEKDVVGVDGHGQVAVLLELVAELNLLLGGHVGRLATDGGTEPVSGGEV